MSMLTEWDIGDGVRLTGSFYVGTTLTDPSTITLVVTKPSGSADTYTYGGGQLTKSGTGVYYRDVVVDTSGEWHFIFTGTGAVAAAVQGRFAVKRSL